MSNRWATSANAVISTLKSFIIVNETMNADSSEDCLFGESPMFRCDQKGETPKVTQIVIVLNSVVSCGRVQIAT